ncbi:uncharacterized protein LOC143549634 [Bidens hawaiensis]|uniref:uncharacterized protein LOC143549634 n=1 Tax=Bidens hawaiensis TaxID=980011 RepID=UPI00404AC713
MSKNSTSLRNSGAYTSPGTPDYADNKHTRTSVNILMPFNNGKPLPSKWDDAERWITSPVSGSRVCSTLEPETQRRPKSKSGPLGPAPDDGYFSSYSPGFGLVEGGSTNNMFAGSPVVTTGVLVPSGYSFGGSDAHSVNANIKCKRASSELLIESSSHPDSQVVSRRDMATQMSPVDIPDPSPKIRDLLSTSAESNNHRSARPEVKDVQVDKRATMTKQPKRRNKKIEKNESTKVNDRTLTWNPIEGSIESSKVQKEEARITAWENLQIAKAEASIRKLEMKLEKKKTKSMDNIIKKLRNAQMKAEEMRIRMSENEAPKTSLKVMSCFCSKQYP